MPFYRGLGDVDAGTESGRVLRSQNNLSDVNDAATARTNLGLGGVVGASNIGYAPTGTIGATNVQDAIDEVVSDLSASSGSSVVGFIQSGASAVTRTLQAEARERVAVTQFGAVADGVTDDKVAFEAAAVRAGTNGTVRVPAGNYKLSSVPAVPNGATFLCDYGATFVTTNLKNSTNCVSRSLDSPDARYFSHNLETDSIDVQAIGGAFVNGIKCVMYPTAAATGGRQAVVGQVIMNNETDVSNNNARWIGVVGHVRAGTSQGGTGTTPATARGAFFGMNPYAYLSGSAQNIRHITGGEVNTFMDTGSTCWFKAGWSIVSLDKEQATIDCGLNIGADAASPGFKSGVYFGSTNGGYAIGSTGTFFQADNYTAAGSLMEFPGISFSGNIINTSACKIEGTGTTTLGTGAGSVELAFKTDATAATVDSRILASGGTASAYGGTLQYQSATHVFTGTLIRPSADNAVSYGSASFRLSALYSREVRPGAGAVIWTSGTGTPEGSVTAPIGSMYTRTDGGAGTTLYVKESGTGNTGWVAK